MKQLVFFLFTAILLLPRAVVSETISLEACYKLAAENFPKRKQLGLNDEILKLKLNTLGSKYYPEMSLFAKAQYQSDVTKININIPIPNAGSIDIPEPPKDQYSAGINISQLIFDGGAIAARQDIEKVNTLVNKQDVEIETYALRQTINQAYFSVMIADKNIELLKTMRKDLESKLSMVRVAIKNGILLQSSADAIKAEMIKIDQKNIELNSVKSNAFDVLTELTGKEVSDIDTNIKDFTINGVKHDKQRPEYRLFDLNKERLNRSLELIDSKNAPKASFFGQAFYGRPGFNMFESDFKPYFVAGIQASWNLWDWESVSMEKQSVEVQKKIINTLEENFDRNIAIASLKYLNNIDKLEEQIKKDREIIQLRENISKESAQRLKNGVITSSDYISDANSELMARMDSEMRKIQIYRAKVEYLTLIGKTNR